MIYFSLRDDSSIVISKPDKENEVIIMNKSDYHSTMLHILNKQWRNQPLLKEGGQGFDKRGQFLFDKKLEMLTLEK